MIKPIREKAGLGTPPSEYHNNCPECINHVFKMKVDRKKSPLDEFCQKMRSLVQDQQNHLIRAITSRGEYRLHPAFKEFEVSPSKWFGLNEANRTQHIQRLQNAASKYMEKFRFEISSVLATPSTSKTLLPNLSQEELHDASHEIPKEHSSCSFEHDDGGDRLQNIGLKGDGRVAEWVAKLSKDTTVPESTICNIFEKADELLTDSKAITAAPIQGEGRMVKSKSNPSRPHLVQVVKGAKLVCDETCPMWTSLKLCSHCVAVAHTVGCLNGFVEWYVANAKKLNITKLTTKCVPRSVGKKSSHSRYSQRKGKAPITVRVPPTFTDQSASSAQEHIAGPSLSKSLLPPHHMPGSDESFSFTERETSVGTHAFGYADPYPYWNPYLPMHRTLPFLSSSSFSSSVPPPLPPPSSFLGHGATCPPYPPTSLGHGAGSPCTPTHFPISRGTSASPYVPTYHALGHGVVSTSDSPAHYLFWVCKLNNRITTCYGCRGKFTRAADGRVPVPPLDLILKCNENRQYYDKDGNLQEKEKSNTYYHPNISCIKKKHPEFQCTDLRIEEAMRASLHPTHFDLLLSVFNINI